MMDAERNEIDDMLIGGFSDGLTHPTSDSSQPEEDPSLDKRDLQIEISESKKALELAQEMMIEQEESFKIIAEISKLFSDPIQALWVGDELVLRTGIRTAEMYRKFKSFLDLSQNENLARTATARSLRDKLSGDFLGQYDTN
jgi:hypothetical protein